MDEMRTKALEMTLINMIEATRAEDPVIVEYHDNHGKIKHYNADEIPEDLESLEVSFIELIPQEDKTTAICYTVYAL